MSNIDKQALRDIAEKTKIAGEAPVMPFEQRINALNDFMKHFTPATALASLTAEPVAYADPQSFDNFKSMGGKNAACTKEWMWRDSGEDLIPVYTAPPAPAVPTFDEWLEIRGNKPLGWVKDAMRESYDACRAAMLNGGKS